MSAISVILPHGVLFRGAAEGHIRRYLIKDCNWLDAVIGLPANIFYGTSIPTCILVFKKCREHFHNYLKYCFSSISFRKQILAFATSSANTNVNQDSLVKIALTYPCKLEQEKIANFLSAIDSKIEAINKQIEQVETFKKGLLQKIFV